MAGTSRGPYRRQHTSAFGIDAWWAQRNAAAEKNVMLESVKAEMLSDLTWVKSQCAYRKASLGSVEILLEAVAAGRYEDTERTLDRKRPVNPS